MWKAVVNIHFKKGDFIMSVPTKSDFTDAIKQLKIESRALGLEYI